MKYSERLYNEDMAPTPQDKRTWNMWHIAALWVGMSVCIPTYMLAADLIRKGLNWWEAVLLILLGNGIVLCPMLMNAHAGTKYGIPFPVLLRTSFGHRGAHIPAMLRALVACGWFGIHTWLGGTMLHAIVHKLAPGFWPDSFGYKFAMYIFFWLVNLYYVWNGTESIKFLESWAAPVLIVIGVILLAWAVHFGGGFGAIFARSYDLAKPVVVGSRQGRAVRLRLSPLKNPDGSWKAKSMQLGKVVADGKGGPDLCPITGWIPFTPTYTLLTESDQVWVRFDSEKIDRDKRKSSPVRIDLAKGKGVSGRGRWWIFLIGITAMVAYWATLALNIPDITRFARSQRDQVLGQAIGLPLTMGLYSFIGLAVTCATLNIFPDLCIGADAIWDPVVLIARFDNELAVVAAMFVLAVATLSTNIAANIISPANCLTNAFPRWINFRSGGVIAALVGVLMMPWRLLGFYINWLVTYSGLLGPIMGVMVVDYLLIRRGQIDKEALYTWESPYLYWKGFHLAAVGATVLGIAVVAVGYVVPAAAILAQGAWFSGAITSGLVYYFLAQRPTERSAP